MMVTPELILAVVEAITRLRGMFGGNSEEEQRIMQLIRDLTEIGAEHIPEVVAALKAGKTVEEVRELMKGMRKPVEPLELDVDGNPI